jgi:thioredoxin reductase (NADPH)
MVETPPISTPALIIGAGPVGLFQAFQLGLLGIQSHIVDALPQIGGQCTELYPEKPIYDIPGIVACSGKELVDNLWRQAAPFAPTFHGEQIVQSIQPHCAGRWFIRTNTGLQFDTQVVFIAAGVGAFLPRTLHLAGLDTLNHPQIAHRFTNSSSYANKRVIIFGDNDAAIQFALRLCPAHEDGLEHKARTVTLVHRREQLQAQSELLAPFKALQQSGHIRFVVGQVTGHEAMGETLRALTITQPDDETIQLPVDKILILWGLSPKLGPVSEWGLEMERKQLRVDTEKFQTSAPGIFAVGDINNYPGKKKLIVCGFHEATMAAYAAASVIFPDKKVAVQYTTSIPPAQRPIVTLSST